MNSLFPLILVSLKRLPLPVLRSHHVGSKAAKVLQQVGMMITCAGVSTSDRLSWKLCGIVATAAAEGTKTNRRYRGCTS